MPCYFPLSGFWVKAVARWMRHPPSLSVDPLQDFRSMTVPCQQCVGCRLERARQWAVRCEHEMRRHDRNCFITLTFDDDHLPDDGSICVRDMQLFMKRLRKKFGAGVRFYMCGEYGDQFGRPHYHACLFNMDFPDKYKWRVTANGDTVYRSEILERLWPFGQSEIGSVTFESAAYIARYIMKKMTGELAVRYYEYVDSDGVVTDRVPEYTNMSRMPGIGSDWLSKYRGDVYPSDFIVLNNKKFRPPRFYDNRYEIDCPKGFKRVKRKRKSKFADHAENNTPDRLKVRERIAMAKLERLKRGVD